MSRKLLALISALLLLTLATYVYYRRTLAAAPVDPYALVPDDAVFVLSTHDHPTLVRHLQETQIWDNLTAVRYFQQAAGHLSLADSLARGATRRRGVLQLLGRKLVITSVHVTGAGSFDVLYQVPLSRVSEYRQVRGLLESLGRDPRYRLTAREYENHELTVLTERRTEASLTVLNYRNHLLISANPGLVEAVVRRLEHPGAPTVLSPFANTDLLKVRELDATLLVNYRRLPKFLDVLFKPETHAPFDLLTSMASEGILGLKLTGSRAELQGFSNPETARGALHQLLRGQPAQALRLADIMSSRTALLMHLAATPSKTWASGSTPADTVGKSAALDSLRATLGREMSVAYLAAASPGSRPGRLAFAYCPQPARTAQWLARLRRLHNNSPAFTKVGAYQLHPIGFSEAALLGPLLDPHAPYSMEVLPGASSQVGHYLVLGDALTLSAYLTDVAANKVWSQNPAQVAFLQKTLPLARLGIYVDTRNSWNALLGALSEERRAGLLRNESLFKRFSQLALQLMPADNENASDAQYFTQLVLHHPSQNPAQVQGEGTGTGRGIAFKRPLMGLPTLLTAPGTRVPAVVVQDSAGAVQYVSADNAVLWTDTLSGPAVGVQLLPGGLLLGAGHRLHLLGNDGRNVAPFPLNLPDSVRIASVQAALGTAGEPALLLAETAGNTLFLLDARGRLYPGWQPRRLDFSLAGAPLLLRVNGRAVVVAALKNGYVYAYDQQGGLYPGFPLSVGARLAGGIFVQNATTLSRSRLTVVNQHGELVSFTLSGDVLTRSRVATWSRTAEFRLVTDQRKSSYVVTREDAGRLDVFEAGTSRPLISQAMVTSGPKPVQLFDFGRGHRMLTITEPGPGHVFLFSGQGKPLGAEPLPSTGRGVAISYDATSDTYQLVRLVGNELRRLDLKVN